MHIVQVRVVEKLAEKKNFLILAIGVGVFGIIIGGITIWNMASNLLEP